MRRNAFGGAVRCTCGCAKARPARSGNQKPMMRAQLVAAEALRNCLRLMVFMSRLLRGGLGSGLRGVSGGGACALKRSAGALDGLAHGLVRAAAADVAVHGLVDLRVRGRSVFAEKRDR